MNDNELNKITSKFNDVKSLIEEQHIVLKKLNKLRKRLKTKKTHYEFIKTIIDIDSAGDDLVNACVILFKDLGFDEVENVDRKYSEEDIRLFHKDRLIIMEVTGDANANPKQAKVHQISQHIPIRQKQHQDKELFGLFIINHDNKKHYKKRSKNPFNEKLIEIAKSHNYTLMTTADLLNAYKMIKMEKLKPEELIEKLCSTGLFKL
jgi:hypothetical protein